ncbi:unnamed protein product [Rangifer tarandus platyrhynchus]|uniref:Uncharacterized protein n=1 Tax=Rangifer tarandus platyrhynchus TaxID=3082113 RepID=A0AC59YJM8_RANTA
MGRRAVSCGASGCGRAQLPTSLPPCVRGAVLRGSHGEAEDTVRRQSGAWGRLAQGALVSAENPEPSAGWRRLRVIWPLPLAGAWVAGPMLVLSLPGALQRQQGPLPSPITAAALAMSSGGLEGPEAGGRRGSPLSAGGPGGFSQATALPGARPTSLGQSSSVCFLHSMDLV